MRPLLSLDPPPLIFSPLAWLKLQFFCHAGDTEVGGFAISRADHLLYIEDFITVRQEASAVTVRFQDAAVADFFRRLRGRGNGTAAVRADLVPHPPWELPSTQPNR